MKVVSLRTQSRLRLCWSQRHTLDKSRFLGRSFLNSTSARGWREYAVKFAFPPPRHRGYDCRAWKMTLRKSARLSDS
jgi:hypothetical protein